MFKNQLQELAQRSCFNLPSYACIREGPDHMPRFKATVTLNGESFESPGFCNTLRQAEHAAAEVALHTLSMKGGPTQSLAARILDETGVCKNLLQETAQRAGVNLPEYSVARSGPGHMPVFVSTVQVAGMSFVGESAKTKKQAEKNAAMAAWASLKKLVSQGGASSQSPGDSSVSEEQLQISIGRALMKAAQEGGSAAPRMQGSPSVARPVPSSRIRITPLEECPSQETIVLQMPAARASVQAKADPPTSRREQAVGNLEASSSQDSFNESSYTPTSGSSSTASRITTSRPCGIIGRRPAQVQTYILNPGTDSQVTLVPIDHFQQADSDWLQSGTSTIIITDSNDTGSADSPIPVLCPAYTPMMRMSDSNQYVSTVFPGGKGQPTISAFKPATSLAPRVRVRQTVPACSAPPCASKVEEVGANATEAATRQSLGNLKL